MTRSESMTSLDQLEKINQYGGDGEGSLWAPLGGGKERLQEAQASSGVQRSSDKSQPCPIAEN